MGVARVNSAKCHQVSVVNAELFTQGAQMFIDQTAVKSVMSRRNRRVRGKYRFLGNFRCRLIKRFSIPFHSQPGCFQNGKRIVSFV